MLFTSKDKLASKLSDILAREYYSYGKTRVSGSKNFSYFMHQRSTCMPGQKDLFVMNSTTKPKEINENNMLQMSRLYKIGKNNPREIVRSNQFITRSIDEFTFNQFSPYCDESLNLAIIAAYNQIYGNLKPMESEIPKELERRLRNGDIPIKEFIRGLAKSDFYIDNFFNRMSQKRSIQLTFIHILGRPIINQKELIKSINLSIKKGFEVHIDHLIDSSEYNKYFGEDIVPYQRCWKSSYNMRTSSFVKIASYRNGSASSDNVIYK